MQEIDGQQVYQFDPTKMKDAHRYCKMMVEEALALAVPTIIIDNTNITAKEFSEYLDDAKERGYKTAVVGIECRDEADAEVFFRRCVHGVPLSAILQMKKNYVVTGSDLMIPPWIDDGTEQASAANHSAVASLEIVGAAEPEPEPEPASPRGKGKGGKKGSPRKGGKQDFQKGGGCAGRP